jgi:hypothetical protein
MPRYFFHLVYGTRVIRDEEGLFLNSLNVAEVRQSLREILGADQEYEGCEIQRLEVASEEDETMFTIPF